MPLPHLAVFFRKLRDGQPDQFQHFFLLQSRENLPLPVQLLEFCILARVEIALLASPAAAYQFPGPATGDGPRLLSEGCVGLAPAMDRPAREDHHRVLPHFRQPLRRQAVVISPQQPADPKSVLSIEPGQDLANLLVIRSRRKPIGFGPARFRLGDSDALRAPLEIGRLAAA
jgi:hypothetical protein